MGSIIHRADNVDHYACVMLCVEHLRCLSINYHKKSKKCELNSREQEVGKNVKKKSKDGWLWVRTNEKPLNVSK